MSAAGLAAGSAVRVSGNPIEAGPQRSATDSSTPSDFPELLSKMATAGNGSASRPAISIAERRPAWGKEMLQVVGTQDEESEGQGSALTALLGSESESSADAGDQASAAQPTAASPSLDAAFAGMRASAVGASFWSSTVHVPSPIVIGTSVPQEVPGIQNDSDPPQPPSADAAILVATAREMLDGGAGTAPGTPEMPGVFVLPQDAPRDLRAVVGAGAPAGQLLSVLAQETHIAPAVLPPLAQGVRDRVGRVTVADEGEAPGQGTEQVDSALLPARAGGLVAAKPMGALAEQPPSTTRSPSEQGGGRNADGGLGNSAAVTDRTVSGMTNEPTRASSAVPLSARPGGLAAAKPVGPSAEQLPSTARSPSEQDSSRDADGELGNSVSANDRIVSGMANESPRATGVTPLPAHQVAGQIVAAAHAIQREDAEATGVLAPKLTVAPVVKVLRLELQPADLGTITIRMSLKQDGLDIRVEASRYDTACMLQRDQDSLAKLLTSAGYRIDGMTVAAAPTDSAAAPDGRSQAFLPSSTPQHGGSPQPDARSSGGRPNAEADARASRGNQDDDNDKSRIVRGPGGDRYV